MYNEETKTLTEWEAEERYEEFLNEAYGYVTIAGLEYATGTALKRLDHTAFRCGMLEWLDSEGIEIEEVGQPVSE